MRALRLASQKSPSVFFGEQHLIHVSLPDTLKVELHVCFCYLKRLADFVAHEKKLVESASEYYRSLVIDFCALSNTDNVSCARHLKNSTSKL